MLTKGRTQLRVFNILTNYNNHTNLTGKGNWGLFKDWRYLILQIVLHRSVRPDTGTGDFAQKSARKKRPIPYPFVYLYTYMYQVHNTQYIKVL